MKKGKILFIILFIFFCSNLDVLAFNIDYKYNYEVNNLSRNSETGKITISGWAIFNAGLGNPGNFHQPLTKSLGSGTSKHCTGSNPGNRYYYNLYAVPVESAKDSVKNNKTSNAIPKDATKINDDVLYGDDLADSIDLTFVMCTKNNKLTKCNKNVSSCYENVGWSFTFDESILKDAKFKNGYVFYLEMKTTGDSKVVQRFPLAVYGDRIKNLDYKYYNKENENGAYQVEVVVTRGNMQKIVDNDAIGKVAKSIWDDSGKCVFKPGKVYTVNDTIKAYPKGTVLSTVGETSQIYHYQLAGANCTDKNNTKYVGYAPASWVAPLKGTFTAFNYDPPTFEFCNPNEATTQEEVTKEIKACSGTKNFSGETSLTDCSVDIYDYYTLACKEDKFEASFSVNDSNAVDIFNNKKEYVGQKFSINHGGRFFVKVNLKTKLECRYDFNYDKFINDYEDINDVINYTLDDKERPDYIKKREKMNEIIDGYYNQTNNIGEWDSGYDFDSIGVSLDVTGVDGSERLLTNGEIKHEPLGDNWCNVSETKNITTIDKNGNTKTYKINSKVSCGEYYEKELIPTKKCLSMQTGNIEACSSSKEQLDGGNYVYVNLDSTSGEIKIKVTKAGFNENFYVNLSNCYYNAPNDMDIKFRQIDLSDPFLQSYGNRQIGSNYSNKKYNFVNIIESDIWEKPFNYRYSLSKTNVKNIRSDTKELGVNSYLGKNCYFTSNNKYVCDFTRNTSNNGTNNQDKWFTKVEINE